jgi:hypothetical protein
VIEPTIDGKFSGVGPIAAGATANLVVTGRAGVPATGVGAVVLNVAATNATAPSFLRAWPTGQPRPTTANLHFTPGQTTSNAIIVKVGEGGQVSFSNITGAVDLVVDVQGWFPASGSFTGVTPARLMDTRPGYTTVDGASAGTGPMAPSSVTNLTVTGRGGVPTTGVGSVVVNITVANPSASSFMTAWPAGAQRPNTANLNYVPGEVMQNMAIVKIGANGQISLYNFAGSTDAIVDVLGWFPDAKAFAGLTPARLMDTRPGGTTTDGQLAGAGAIGSNSVKNLAVLGRGGVPSTGVGAVALSVTVTNPTLASFLTVWASGTPRPTAANLNFPPARTIQNMVIARVGDGGQVSLYNLAGTTDVVVDVLGWFPADPSFTAVGPARLMDSRRP